MTLSLSPDIKTRRGQRHEKCFTSRRTPGAPFCWACFASSVKENLAGESVVETAGAVEKPKNGFPTAPWTFGPQFPQRRLLLVLLQTQLFFYSLLHGAVVNIVAIDRCTDSEVVHVRRQHDVFILQTRV